MQRTNRRGISLYLALAAVIALAVPAMGQAQADRPPTLTQPQQQQQPVTPGRQPSMQQATPMEGEQAAQANLLKMADLIGKDVMTADGQDLGSIHDVVLNNDLTKVSYVVLAHGGFLGIGDKFFAVPWTALTIEGEADKVTLDIEPSKLEQAQGFNQDQWPTEPNYELFGGREQAGTDTGRQPMGAERDSGQDVFGYEEPTEREEPSTPSWMRPDAEQPAEQPAQEPIERSTGDGLLDEQSRDDRSADDQVFGYSPQDDTQRKPAAQGEHPQPGMHEPAAAAPTADFWARKLSGLIGLDVTGQQDEDLGDIEDIVVTSDKGEVVYTILSYGGVLGVGAKMAVVPWSAVSIRPADETAAIDITRATLDAVAFEEANEPNLEDRAFAENLYQQFGEQPHWEVFGYQQPESRIEHQGDAARERTTDAWKADSEYNKLFDVNAVQTINGTILSVGTFRPAPGAVEGLRLRVQTDDGKPMTIHAGPATFATKHNISFRPGDTLTITGSPATVNERSVLIAQKIQKGEQTLELRDNEGKPLWNVDELMAKPSHERSMQPDSMRPAQPARPGMDD